MHACLLACVCVYVCVWGGGGEVVGVRVLMYFVDSNST